MRGILPANHASNLFYGNIHTLSRKKITTRCAAEVMKILLMIL